MTVPGRAASVTAAMTEHPDRHAEPGMSSGHYQPSVRNEMVGMDLGMRVLSYLIAGVLVYGGLGWLGDHVLGTGFLLPVGIVLGAAGGCYVIIRRYGQDPSPQAKGSGGTSRGRMNRWTDTDKTGETL